MQGTHQQGGGLQVRLVVTQINEDETHLVLHCSNCNHGGTNGTLAKTSPTRAESLETTA